MFFLGKLYVNCGIFGQIMVQMLVCFCQDVIDLCFVVVVIFVGINDIVGNMGLVMLEMIEDNFCFMIVLVQFVGIWVIFVLVLFIMDYFWYFGLQLVGKICVFNVWLKLYVVLCGVIYFDYYDVLVNVQGGMDIQFVSDGVYLMLVGYVIMVLLVQQVIDQVLVVLDVGQGK